jgi:hypothetical protein
MVQSNAFCQWYSHLTVPTATNPVAKKLMITDAERKNSKKPTKHRLKACID